MASSGDTSPRCEDSNTHAQLELEQKLKDVKEQLEMTTTQMHMIEEELAETHETYKRTLEEKDQALKEK